MSRSSDAVIADWLAARVAPAARWSRRHPVARDLAVTALIILASLIGIALQGHRLQRLDVVAFCVALPAPLVLRAVDRRLSFALIAVIALAQWALSTPQLADGAVLVALFWIALDGELTELALAGAIVEAGAVMAALRWSPAQPAKAWVAITGLGVAAGGLGVALRERRALVDSLRERAARLEFERDQEGRLAAVAERARIAREMHDIVSHNLTVMIALADGAAYALADAPDSSLAAMHRVSGTGRQALGEMRRLLGVLHEEPGAGPYAPQPGLDRLEDLLGRVQAAGIPVSTELAGNPHELPAGVQLTVFRVAQEALTNTLKHAARPASAHLRLRCDGGRVELEVTDVPSRPPTRQDPAPVDPETTPGRGLRGMRERAAAYDGSLAAGPQPGGGWRVRLAIDGRVSPAASPRG